MSLGNSVTTRLHLAIQTESRAGYFTPMRFCTGGCKTRRSIAQFKGDSTVCIRCARRNPCHTGAQGAPAEFLTPTKK